MYKPISLKGICLFFPYQGCFEDFSTQIPFGSKIAIIGRNGSGKSSLLKILANLLIPTSGAIEIPSDFIIAYVPQTITEFDTLSGGQRFNKLLTNALAKNPDILLLDEPTNHLDTKNRRSLMKMLKHYYGTLIIVSHDTEVLRKSVDTLWHIEQGRVHIFNGSYDDYINSIAIKHKQISKELSLLEAEKLKMHNSLMQEQVRASKSKVRGYKSIDNKKWPTVVSKTKATRAQQTSGKKRSEIDKKKDELSQKLLELNIPKIIIPHFKLPSSEHHNKILVSIDEGAVKYNNTSDFVLTGISFSLKTSERIAIVGDNGSGKSTFVKAIIGCNDNIIRSGEWHAPDVREIGYLDQHYSNLDDEQSVFQTIADIAHGWNVKDIRKHLQSFLFRTNNEVERLVKYLSGGECMRLSLASIAARELKLLILDEITNNIDLETKKHVIQVLQYYPGAMIIISHDDDFLNAVGIDTRYDMFQNLCNESI